MMDDKVRFRGCAPRLFAAAALVTGFLVAGASPALAEDAPPPPSATVLEDVTVPAAGKTGCCLTRRTPRYTIGIEGGAGIYPDPEGILGLPIGRAAMPYDWDRNDFDLGPALRATVTRHLGGCDRLELRGSYQWWDADSRQTGRFGYSQTPGAVTIVSPTSEATLENEVRLWSVELNWWKNAASLRTSSFAWGVGARVIGLTDKGIAKDWVGLAPGAYLEGKARNTLWAGQLMGAWNLRPNRRFELSVIGKALAGAMNRDMTEKDTSIVTGGATTNAEREETDFGWGLEGEIRAVWRPWNRVGLSAAYTVLFLDEVSRGHEILDFSQAATGSIQIQDAKDSVVIHTFYFGIQFDL